MKHTKIALLNSLIRLPNILLSLLAGFVFCHFYLNEQIADLNFTLAMIIVLLSIASGNMINDYYDFIADQDKKAFKAIASGEISRTLVLKLYIFLNLITLTLSFLYLPIYSTYCLIVNILFLFLYSYKIKATVLLGNICVAYLSASIFVYLGLVYNKFELALFPSFFAFFMHLIREIIKDLEDEQADKKNNVKTLVVVYGDLYSKKIVQILIIVAIIFFLLIIFFIINQRLVQYLFLGLIILPLIFIIFSLDKKLHERDFNKISQLLKILMLIGIILLIVAVNDFTTFRLFK